MLNILKPKIHPKIFLLLALTSILMGADCLAQTESKQQQIKWGSYEGYAKYDYTVLGKDTLLDGNFSLNGPVLDTFKLEQQTYYSINGKFSNNKPVSHWQLNKTLVLALNKSTFNDSFIRINTNANTHQITCSIASDGEEASWKHDILNIRQGQHVGNIFTAKINENQELNKTLTIKTLACQLNGQINNENYANGNWEWFYNKDSTSNKWKFEAGFLTEVIVNDSSISLGDQFKSSNSTKVKTLPLSKQFINVLTLKLALIDFAAASNSCVSVLSQLDSLEEVRREFFEILEQTYVTPAKFKLLSYELSKVETKQLDSITDLHNIMDSLFTEVYTIKEPEVFKNNFPTVVPLLDTINLIFTNEFRAIKEIKEMYKSNIISYFNRNYISEYVFKKHQPIISSGFDSLFDLNTFIKHSKHTLWQINDLKQRIDTLNNLRKQQKTLLILEQNMLNKRNILSLAIDSALLATPDKYADGVKAILSFSDRLIMDFNQANSVLEKLIIAEQNLSCFDNLLALIQLLLNLPKEEKNIIKLYTKSDYNVFTATDIEYLTKKRIVESYTEKLIPYFYNELLYNLSCKNSTYSYNIIFKSTKRLYELREESTQELEKKLNQRLSNDEILDALGVKIELIK